MGIISTAIVITSLDRQARAKKVQPSNREQVIVIQGVSSQGWVILPFVIIIGKNHLISQYKNSGFLSDWVIAITENSWTTNERSIDWIQHFEKYIKPQSISGYHLLILNGYKSYHSKEFEEYYKEYNIITLYIPTHLSHLLQPLNIGCFGLLKKAYSRQIEDIIQSYISHITKDDFFPAFYTIFNTAITESNI